MAVVTPVRRHRPRSPEAGRDASLYDNAAIVEPHKPGGRRHVPIDRMVVDGRRGRGRPGRPHPSRGVRAAAGRASQRGRRDGDRTAVQGRVPPTRRRPAGERHGVRSSVRVGRARRNGRGPHGRAGPARRRDGRRPLVRRLRAVPDAP